MNLDELRELSEKATAGPWMTWHGDDSYAMNCAGLVNERCDHEYVDDDGHAQHTVALTLLQQPRYASHVAASWDEDAAFIVAAVDYVRSLLSESDR